MNVLDRLTRERTADGRRAPSVLDWLVALALLVIALLEVSGGMFAGPVGVAAAAQLAAILPVAFRRVAPLRAIAFSAAVLFMYVIAYGASGARLPRIMTAPFAVALVFCTLKTLATSSPSPVIER